LLENVDERVVAQLKARGNEIHHSKSEFERQLLLLAHAELPEARFHPDDDRRFDFRGDTYTVQWPLADEKGWKFFRLFEGTLATELVERAKARTFDRPAHLRFHLADYRGGRLADVERLRGVAGWLQVAKLKIATPAVTREHLVVSILPDLPIDNLHQDTIERLFRVPAAELGAPPDPVPAAELKAIEDRRRQDLLEEAEHQNADWLDTESNKLDSYADDLERSFDAEIKALEGEIKAAKKALRGAPLAMQEKVDERKRIAGLETRRDKMKAEFFDRRARIRADVEEMLDRIQASLKMEPTLTPLFVMRWEVQ